MENNPRGKCFAAMSAWVCLTTFASGETLYSNFGPGDTYNSNPSSGYLVQRMPTFYQFIAGSFVVPGAPGESFALTSVDVALRGDGLHPIILEIASSKNGVPGNVLEAVPKLASSGGIYSADFSETTWLEAGSKYWIIAEASLGLSGLGTWYSNLLGVEGLAASNGADPNTGLQWVLDPVSTPAFRVSGVLVHEVPESASTAALLFVSYGSLVFVRRSRFSPLRAKP